MTTISGGKSTQPVSGTVAVSNFPASQAITSTDGAQTTIGTTTDASTASTLVGLLKAVKAAVQGTLAVTGTFWQAVQPVSGTFWQATQPVSLATNTPDVIDRAARLMGHVTVDSAPTTAVTGTVTSNQGTANATPWNENITEVGGTAVVTSIAGAPGVGGDTADGAADAGKSVKVGGKVTLNSAALPTALTAGQRGPNMVDEYGRQRIITNRPKLLGLYYAHSGILAMAATADAATSGHCWLINPVGSAATVYLKKAFITTYDTAVTAFPTSPRITMERMTFTGTASGASVTPAKRVSTDAPNTATVRTASTGMTITAGAVIDGSVSMSVLTAVGVSMPNEQPWIFARDDDDLLVLAAGEGIVFRQADAGTTSDSRKYIIDLAWEER